jgi:synaptobrevin family protein YKT6
VGQSLGCDGVVELTSSSAIIITDQEYPVRPAFSLLTKLLDDFTAKVPQSAFGNPGSISFPEIQNYIQKYQDPRQADTIMRVQQELDETKIVLVSPPFTM